MIVRRIPPRAVLVCLAAGITTSAARDGVSPPDRAAPPDAIVGSAEGAPSPPASGHKVEPTPGLPPASSASRTRDAEPRPDAKPGATPLDPSELGRLIEFGSNLGRRGDHVAAESALRQVLNAREASPPLLKQALLALAHVHRRQGALTKAAAIYERFLKDYPGDEKVPEALLELGRTLRGLGVYKLALARFYSVINSTLKLPGGDLERYQALARTAQFEIAETHFESGDFAEAAKFYSRLGLLGLAPADRGRVEFKAAHAQRLQGDLAGAVAALQAFLEHWPEDENVPEARYLLAITYRELNRPQEAFAAALELLQTTKVVSAANPGRWTYWQRRTGNQLANEFFESGDTLNARTIYAGLLQLSPEPAWRLPTTYQLGLCDERLGQFDQARAWYREILDTLAAKPAPQWNELQRMAAWRLEHLAWRDQARQQVRSLLDTATGKHAVKSPPSSSTTPPNRDTPANSPGT